MTRQPKLIRNWALCLSSLTAFAAVSSGCGDSESAAFRVTQISPGAVCEHGGIKYEAGLDENEDGKLQDGEVDSSRTVTACAMIIDGKNALVETSEVAPNPAANNGVNGCINGGYRVKSGLDKNSNGILDSGDQIQSDVYLCFGLNGQNGTNGTNGTNGQNGQNGTNGTNGTNGHNSMVRVSPLPATMPVTGPNQCEFGGTKIDAGVDTNDNGTLQDLEVQTTSVVCSVAVLANVIVESSIILPNAANPVCVQGGVHMIAGVDTNGDRTLQPGEITATSDVCNLIQTVPGHNSLINTFAATSAQCAWGGYVMQTGVDNNNNNVLNAGEVDGTSIVCNGADGAQTLVSQSDVAANPNANNGVNGCVAGGITFTSWLDTNHNSVRDAGEPSQTGYICNGYTGPQGSAGLNSLIRQTADTVVCGFPGGVKIDSGTDNNANGALETSEVDFTSYVCNGYDGFTTLVRPVAVAPGASCEFGGINYQSGQDTNGNGVLNNNEVTDDAIVCNGYDGVDGQNGADGYQISIDELSEGDFVCPNGGAVIYVGYDDNNSGYVDSWEAEQTTYLCIPGEF